MRGHYGAKLVVMNIGDGFSTGPKEAAYVINKLVKPASVIASHANKVDTLQGKVRPGSKTETFMKAVKVPVHIPRSGKMMELILGEVQGGLPIVGQNVRTQLAGGCPAASHFTFASPKESNQRKGDPAIPEFPKFTNDLPRSGLVDGYAKPESAGRAAQKLGSLVLIFKVSEPQTSTPLIRPADPDFGGAGRDIIETRMHQGLTIQMLRNLTPRFDS